MFSPWTTCMSHLLLQILLWWSNINFTKHNKQHPAAWLLCSLAVLSIKRISPLLYNSSLCSFHWQRICQDVAYVTFYPMSNTILLPLWGLLSQGSWFSFLLGYWSSISPPESPTKYCFQFLRIILPHISNCSISSCRSKTYRQHDQVYRSKRSISCHQFSALATFLNNATKYVVKTHLKMEGLSLVHSSKGCMGIQTVDTLWRVGIHGGRKLYT